MTHTHAVSATIIAVLALAPVGAQEERFVPLFNGDDLSGWELVNTPPETWSVEDGMLICSGRPIGEIRTEKMYQNFVLELEWRHMVRKGNAGVFVWADDVTARGVPFHRSIEVQVLENAYGNTRSHTTHGDIFPIHGATMIPVNGRGGSRAFPSEERSKPSPEWNHYRIECRDGNISLAVNGKVVTRGTDCSPRKGYICLESEGGIVHYRNIRIQELPDSPIDEEHIAVANRGFRSIYSGLDLTGWKARPEAGQWHARDWVLSHDSDSSGTLESAAGFGQAGFIFDVRVKSDDARAALQFRGSTGEVLVIDLSAETLSDALQPSGRWNRIEVTIQRSGVVTLVNGAAVDLEPIEIDGDLDYSVLLSATGQVDFANIFVRELRP